MSFLKSRLLCVLGTWGPGSSDAPGSSHLCCSRAEITITHYYTCFGFVCFLGIGLVSVCPHFCELLEFFLNIMITSWYFQEHGKINYTKLSDIQLYKTSPRERKCLILSVELILISVSLGFVAAHRVMPTTSQQ